MERWPRKFGAADWIPPPINLNSEYASVYIYPRYPHGTYLIVAYNTFCARVNNQVFLKGKKSSLKLLFTNQMPLTIRIT